VSHGILARILAPAELDLPGLLAAICTAWESDGCLLMMVTPARTLEVAAVHPGTVRASLRLPVG